MSQTPPKDKRIKLFRIKEVSWKNEANSGTYTEKVYLHPKKDFLWASFLQIVSDTSETKDSIDDVVRFTVRINNRSDVKSGDYIEYGDSTYKIVAPPDRFDCTGGDLKLTVQKVDQPDSYKRVCEKAWGK
jgi:Phage head-tail joining protein.